MERMGSFIQQSIANISHKQMRECEHIIRCLLMRSDLCRLKWKPPEENSVDFRLELRFPKLPDTNQPDLMKMPMFLLYVWEGGSNYAFYDYLTVDDDEWEEYVV